METEDEIIETSSAGTPDVVTDRFVTETGRAVQIAAIIEPILIDMGYRLVRIAISKRDGGTMQIMADKSDGIINVDDCALISRRISPLFDVNDPMEGRYFLEVSSPGIDRILVRPSDFEDWSGYEAKIELREGVEGRRRFKGTIEGYEDGELRLHTDVDGKNNFQTIGLALPLIQEAKLILTDELIKASLKQAKASGQKWVQGSAIEDLENSHIEQAENDNGADRN